MISQRNENGCLIRKRADERKLFSKLATPKLLSLWRMHHSATHGQFALWQRVDQRSSMIPGIVVKILRECLVLLI